MNKRSRQSSKKSKVANAIKQQDKVDIYGIQRSSCTNCSECPQFISVSGHVLCAYCGCPPAKHDKVDRKRGRESESDKAEADSGSFDSDEASDFETETSSSGVSSYSGNSSSRQRRTDWTWRPSNQV